jgi:hypothetical protein
MKQKLTLGQNDTARQHVIGKALHEKDRQYFVEGQNVTV